MAFPVFISAGLGNPSQSQTFRRAMPPSYYESSPWGWLPGARQPSSCHGNNCRQCLPTQDMKYGKESVRCNSRTCEKKMPDNPQRTKLSSDATSEGWSTALQSVIDLLGMHKLLPDLFTINENDKDEKPCNGDYRLADWKQEIILPAGFSVEDVSNIEVKGKEVIIKLWRIIEPLGYNFVQANRQICLPDGIVETSIRIQARHHDRLVVMGLVKTASAEKANNTPDKCRNPAYEDEKSKAEAVINVAIKKQDLPRQEPEQKPMQKNAFESKQQTTSEDDDETNCPEKQVPATRDSCAVKDSAEQSNEADEVNAELISQGDQFELVSLTDGDPENDKLETEHTRNCQSQQEDPTSGNTPTGNLTDYIVSAPRDQTLDHILEKHDIDTVDKPAMDEDNKGFQFCVDVQQYHPNEISVKLVGSHLMIEGTHHEEEDGNISEYHFKRQVVIPDNVDLDQLKSHLSAEGTLIVTAPWSQISVEQHEKKIPIEFGI